MSVGSVGKTRLPPSAPLYDTPATVTGGFSDFLQDALSNVVAADAAHKGLTLEAITGGDVDIHNIIIAANKAELTLSLTLQLRSKIIDSYQEMMRMTI